MTDSEIEAKKQAKHYIKKNYNGEHESSQKELDKIISDIIKKTKIDKKIISSVLCRYSDIIDNKLVIDTANNIKNTYNDIIKKIDNNSDSEKDNKGEDDDIFRMNYLNVNNDNEYNDKADEKPNKKEKVVEKVEEDSEANTSEDERNEDLENYTYPKLECNKCKITKKIDPKYGPYGTQWVHDVQKDDEDTNEVKKNRKLLDELMSVKRPEQRTPEWFKVREESITASDAASPLDLNKNKLPFEFYLNKVNNTPFMGSIHCYHGTKYEEIATMIYAYRMNVKVEEFGLIQHPVHKFIGASPDGIVGKYKYDGKHKTKYIGRMLEIKCPAVRKIKKTGDIKGEIVPIYYWVQVQQQLECCNLNECDFWQCSIVEYDSREDFINDTKKDEPFRSAQSGFEKGAIIQLLPFEQSEIHSSERYDQVVYDHAKWLYPPTLEMSPLDYDKWIAESISNLKNHEIYSKYYVDCIKYWKLTDSFCITVERDKEWFEKELPNYRKTWDYVEFLRKNPDKMKILNDYVETFNIEKTVEKFDKLGAKGYKQKKEFKENCNEKIMELLDALFTNKDKKSIQKIIGK